MEVCSTFWLRNTDCWCLSENRVKRLESAKNKCRLTFCCSGHQSAVQSAAPESRAGKERSTTAAGLSWSRTSWRQASVKRQTNTWTTGAENSFYLNNLNWKCIICLLPAEEFFCEPQLLKWLTLLHFTAAETSPACFRANSKLSHNKAEIKQTQTKGGKKKKTS